MGIYKPIAPPEPIIDINNYLTIEAIEPITIQFTSDGCEYCVNGDGNWTTLNAYENIEILRRQYVSFRGNLIPETNVGIGSFDIYGKCNLKGNCMSMLFGDNAADNFSLRGKDYAFYNLFNKCTDIVSVSNNFLPATTLAESCYDHMFSGCHSLTTAPTLPATTLAESCYELMFYDCTSLTTAPTLPATTLAKNCYYSMFNGCKNLNYIKMLATDISAWFCLESWVNRVSSTGTFVKNPAMNSLPTGTSGIPSGWTVMNGGEE